MKKPPLHFFPLSFLCCLLAASAMGQGITLVKNINVQTPPAGTITTDSILNVNGTLFIATDDHLSGSELWKSDGTLSGTVLVKDILPGSGDSEPLFLTSVGTGAASRLLFTAKTGDNERNLWISDGTYLGTKLVKDFNILNGGPEELFALGNTLYFEGFDSTSQRELWKLDITQSTLAPVLVKNINPLASTSSGIDNLTNMGGTLFFTANDGVAGRELWKSSGTEATTTLVADIVPGLPPSNPQELTVFTAGANTYLYFSAQDDFGRELWLTNGTNETKRLVDIEALEGSSDPKNFTPVGNRLYFTAQKTTEGRELWYTDGISDHHLLKDIGTVANGVPSAAASSNPENLTPITVITPGTGEPVVHLLFTADNGSLGVELWKTNGTEPGTVLQSNIATGDTAQEPKSSNPSNFIKLSPTTVLFTATDAAGVLALYKCEGDSGAIVTSKLLDFTPAAGQTVAVARSFVLKEGIPSNKAYFLLNDGEFWTTDGTTPGTVRIKRFRAGEANPVTAGSFPSSITAHGTDVAFFSATDGLVGEELWKTDGTDVGTTLLGDISAGASGSSPQQITSAGTHVFFSATESGAGRELWRTDGAALVERVKDINTTGTVNNPGSSSPQDLFWWANGLPSPLLFFSANNGTQGRELWRSDGTSAGTFMVRDMSEFSDSNPKEFVAFKDRVFFVGLADGAGIELLSTNGVLDEVDVIDVAPSGSSRPQELTLVKDSLNNDVLYFSAEANNKGRELWKSDGTTATLVADIASSNASSEPVNLTAIGKTLYFAAGNGTSIATKNVELWKSDGTTSGTVLVKEIAPGTLSSSPEQLVAVDGKLFFVADNGSLGAELWVSDGTSAGTKMVTDIVVGAGSPGIQDLTSINGIAVFTADNGVNGREVWISDGTALGTSVIRDLTNDGASSAPEHLTALGNRLLYSAATYVSGKEPRIGLLEPEITVFKQEVLPANELATTVGEVDFGTASLVSSRTVSFIIRNDGLNTLKFPKVATVFSGAGAADFSVVSPLPATLGPDASFTLNVKFAPKAVGVRTAVVKILSNDPNEGTDPVEGNDPDEGSFLISLTGAGEAVFTTQPVSQMAVAGDPVQLVVGISTAGDVAPAVQWRRNAGNVAGANSAEYNIPAVTLAQAGNYSAQIKGSATLISNTVQLGVVENIPKVLPVAVQGSAAFTVKAAGGTGTGIPPLTYKWRRQFGANPAEDLPNDPVRFKGVTKNALTVGKVTTADSAVYFCEVSGPGGMKVGGTTELRVFDKAPVIVGFNPPNGIVSGPYNYQVVTSLEPSETATTYAAANLPTGLKLDTKTGLITGYPTKLGDFNLVITASNSKFKTTATKLVNIEKFPDDLAGVYVGPVERSSLNGNLGGRIELTIGVTGIVTGTITMGTAKHSLTGHLDVDVTDVEEPEATIVVKRTGALLPLTVFVEIANNTLIGDSQVNDGTSIAAVDGWRQIWHTTKNPATAYLGYYTFGLELSGGPDTLPQGKGYGSFTVGKDGKITTIAGKTADGEGLTGSTIVGPTGQVMIFQTLYATPIKGSIQGLLQLGLGANLLDSADNTIGGVLDVVRPVDTRAATSARTYEGGFGTPMPVEYDAFGGRHGPIAGDTMVMGFSPGSTNNVRVVFTKGGIETSSDNPNLDFQVGPKNKIFLPLAASNPTSTKFNLVPGTGFFNGSFILDDVNPRTIAPKGTATIKRTVNFFGALVKDGAEQYGVGLFMMPKLPGDGDPLANPVIPPTSSTTSDILSGSVLFEAVP